MNRQGELGCQQESSRLVWAYGRHVNRTVENLGQAFRMAGYELYPFSTAVPRWRKLWPMLATLHWDQGRLRGYSQVHPATYRGLQVPKELRDIPVWVLGNAILSPAPHFFYQDLTFSSILAYREAGLPTFMYDGPPIDLLKRMQEKQRRDYDRATAVFAMSHWVKEFMIREDGVSEEKVFVVGAGSNLGTHYDENPYTTENLEANHLLFIGRDFERKGGPLLLEAWDRVKAGVPNAKLTLLGPGPEYTDDARGIHSLPPQPSAEVAKILGSVTGFVMPSLWEPYGIAYSEAMSMGVPCVGPRIMAVPEIIAHERTGYLYDSPTAAALAESMTRLLTDKEQTWGMSRAAFASAKTRRWAKVQQAMQEVIAPLTRDPAFGSIT